MKSYLMQFENGQGVLSLSEAETPKPGPKQVLVKVRAAALNRGEFIAGHGLHKGAGAKAIGMEAAGEVVAVGNEVSGFKTGDAVMGRCPAAFSEYAVMDVAEAMHKPAMLNWEEAASVPLTFLVVHDMLVTQGRLQAGEWVLVAGVSSGVGVATMQLAKAMGAKVIGTSGSATKLSRLADLGLDVAINTREPKFYEAVLRATEDKGVDLVVNTVGGSVFAECVKSMAFEGRLATVGYVDGVLNCDMDILALHAKRLTLFGVSNKLRNAAQKAAGIPAFRAEVLPMFSDGRIRPLVDKAFAFADLNSAKQMMEGNQQVGKIVITL